jgi:hypothetical protein
MAITLPKLFNRDKKPSQGINARRDSDKPKPSFMPPLSLDAEESEESELRPGSFELSDYDPDEAERDLVRLVMKRFKQSADARTIHEQDWLLCESFREGNQWVESRTGTNTLSNIRDPQDPYRSYFTRNRIRKFVNHQKVRATMCQPDVSVSPWRPGDPTDEGATDEARDILAHYDDLFELQRQNMAWCDGSFCMSTTFKFVGWNPQAMAEVWRRNPDGTLKIKRAQVGDPVIRVVPSYEMYPDPKACRWEDANWIVHVTLETLTHIQDTYGERGYRVNPSSGDDGYSGYIKGHLDAITGDGYRGRTDLEDQAYVYHMWEKSSPRFENGRYIPVSGGILLCDLNEVDWPFADNGTEYPYVPMCFEPRPASVWGMNLVHDMLDDQRALNNCISRTNDWINIQKATILVPQGSQVRTDVYQSRRQNMKITFTGQPPTYQQPPTLPAAFFTYAEQLEAGLQDTAGVRDPSSGNLPQGAALSGVAIDLMMQADMSDIEPFMRAQFEPGNQKVAELLLARCAQFYKEPRYMAVSASSDPTVAASNARDFKNLASGGRVKVKVVPGSAIPKSEAAQVQKIQDMFKAGMLQPQNLPALIPFLETLKLSGDNTQLTETLTMLAARAMKMEQDAAAAQNAQPQAANPVTAIQAKGQIDMALQQADNQGKLTIEQTKQQGQAAMLDAENEATQQVNAEQAEMERQQDLLDAPKSNINIAFKPGPDATANFLTSMGINPGSDAATMTEAATKPAATPGGSNNGENQG